MRKGKRKREEGMGERKVEERARERISFGHIKDMASPGRERERERERECEREYV